MKNFLHQNLTKKKILLRLDLNVPIHNGKILDDFRLQSTLPTIQALLEKKAIPILISHLGRPKGEPNPSYSLQPVAQKLQQLLQTSTQPPPQVLFHPQTIGPTTQTQCKQLQPGQVLVLENLRFHKEEEENSPQFAKQLSTLADIYVNDAFSVCHRQHASVCAITQFLPSFAGLLLEKELRYLQQLQQPTTPYVAILGGAKVKDKLPLIQHLLPKVDFLLLGGAMCYTFLHALGQPTGNCPIQKEFLPQIQPLLHSPKIHLPLDHITAPKLQAHTPTQIQTTIPKNEIAGDIGPQTRKKFKEILQKAKTIVWNGPLGAFEIPNFHHGTHEIATFLANLPTHILRIAGGGDVVAAIRNAKAYEKFSFVSTGGGAFLEMLSGKTLPGIQALHGE
ncbi:MAG: phosphoglycerate kinase [Planctomycetota bacterium]|nr:MAG: phosphoglycerate kinase [Planctomycetota bacterium]